MLSPTIINHLHISGSGIRDITVLSIEGKVLINKILADNENYVDISVLPEGIYLIKVLSGDTQLEQLIIKE